MASEEKRGKEDIEWLAWRRGATTRYLQSAVQKRSVKSSIMKQQDGAVDQTAVFLTNLSHNTANSKLFLR